MSRMSNSIDASIIIPTYNRKESLKETLLSLDKLDYPKEFYEVIVIDDGSTDKTSEVVEELKKRVGYCLTYFRQERKYISAAKNLGIKHSRGKVIISTDDDCLFEKQWLKNILKYFDDPEIGAIGGADRALTDDPFFMRCINYTLTSFAGTGGIRGTDGLSVGKYYPRGFCMAMSKRVIEDVGLFIEGFAPGEEIELGYRMKKSGYKLLYAPDVFVWHKRRATLKGFLRQIFSRGYSRVELWRRHKELLEPAYTLPAVMIMGVVLLLATFPVLPASLGILKLTVGLYGVMLLLVGLFSVRHIKDIRASFVVPFLLLGQHLAYGTGFIYGCIFKGRIKY